ncbi:MAG: sulfotransferase [Actinobacteria bacterium]|nr:sulfotransferase [Actinomycetota bacterium]
MGLMVVGMHRSGTSAVAEVLCRLGLNLGEGTEYEVEAGNARGLYEWRETVEFNDEWLGRYDSAWWAPPRLGANDWREVDLRQLAASRRQLPYFTGEMSNWFVKDPRISLLLPLWDRLLLARSPAVVVVRSPRAVAASIRLRSGMHTARSLALGAEHYRAIYAALEDRPALVVSYEQMLADPATTIAALAQFAAEQGFAVDFDVAEAAGALDPKLRRNRGRVASEYEDQLVASLAELYEPLAAAHLGPPPAGFADYQLPQWATEALDEASELCRTRIVAGKYQMAAEDFRDANAEIEGSNSYRLARALQVMGQVVKEGRRGGLAR